MHQGCIQRIIHCEDPRASDPSVVGPKAANLACLWRGDIPVPAFFVMVSGDEGLDDPPSAISPEIRPEFLEALAWLEQQGGTTFAVRSSANVEDRVWGSLAGQFISEVGLREADEVGASVVRCLAARSSPRVCAYLRKRDIRVRPKVNIIVQIAVQATWAGVAFTGVGAEGRICSLIEARRGHGDAVTSGSESPERVLVIQRPHAFPSVISLIGHLPAQPPRAPDTPDWLSIAQYSHRVHGMLEFGVNSADVEWAWDGVRYWVIQARTGQAPPLPMWVKRSSQETWTSFFFAERFIHPVSRLGWDWIRPSIERRALREPLRYLGYKDLASKPLTRLVAGYPVTRLEAFRRLHELIPPALLPPEKASAFFPDGIPRWQWSRYVGRLWKLTSRVLRDPDALPRANLRRWRGFVPGYVRRVQALHDAIEGHSTPADWLADMEGGEKLSYALLGLHRWSLIFAEGFTGLLQHFLRWGTDYTREDIHQVTFDLLTGVPEHLTAQMNAALRALGTPGSERWPIQLEEFLQRFGHRAASLDLSEPTWREQPGFVKALTMQASRKISKGRPGHPHGRPRTLKGIADRSGGLPGGVRALWWILFRWALKYAEAFTVLRENQRHYWHMVLEQMRRAALKIGASLAAKGVLPCPEGVFDLSRAELQRLVEGGDEPRDMASLLDLRKIERRAWENVALPCLITDEEIPELSSAPASDHAYSVFRGLGVSPGSASGQCFFPSEYDPRSIPKGSILVMPGLDPGWTPVLSLVNGLVAEAGGMLSHGAILAREFGVPAVASVPGIRRAIQPGDWVEIDGLRGIVRVLRQHDRDTLEDR